MLNWFRPRCPVDLREKVWTEQRLGWLGETFGLRRLLDATVVLPTPRFFPDPYRGTLEDARGLLDRICFHMGAQPARIDLELYEDTENPGTLGLYHLGDREVIGVATSQLEDPESLVATLAHEVAHSLLLGAGLVSGAEEDHEWLTDLLPDYLGMGVFVANSVVREQYESTGNYSAWRIARQGYLPGRVHGYALALFAWMRGEHEPEWASHLRLDVRQAMELGLKFVEKTGDSQFNPRGFGRVSQPSQATLLGDLAGASESARLAALWRLIDAGEFSPSLFPMVAKCAAHRDPIVRAAAARALACVRDANPRVLELLEDLLMDRSGEVRAAAAMSFGLCPAREPAVVRLLTITVNEEEDTAVALAAMTALAAYGPNASSAAPALVEALLRALIDGHSARMETALAALLAIAEDPRIVVEHLSDFDEVMRAVALSTLAELQEGSLEPQGPSLAQPTRFGIRASHGPNSASGESRVL